MAALERAAYQLVALTKLISNEQRAILICDGVGVGKTIAAGFILTYLVAANRRSGLVVCPPSLVDKWFLELRSKFALDVVAIRTGEELALTIDDWDLRLDVPRVFIMPSSLLGKTSGARFSGPVVFDEIHNYRNPETQAWGAAKALSINASYRVGLSATPINNGVDDLAAELSILLDLNIYAAQALVQDLWRPGRQEALYPVLTRFTKDRLGVHFAKRIVRDLFVEISESYRAEVISIVKQLRGRPKSESVYLDETTYFRLAASSAEAFSRSTGIVVKTPFDKFGALKPVLDLHESERIIIFCEFEVTVAEVERKINSRDIYVITGSVPVFERGAVLDQFRNSRNGVLLMTSVGAEGIDLQFCSTLVNYDLNWNPMVLEQRIGRIDRIGQTKQEISIYNCIVEGSIDLRIVETLGKKLGLVQGSVLEPSTVIHSLESGKALFTGDDLLAEETAARALAQAMALTAEVIPEDYSLLPSLDASYCDPVKIRLATSGQAQASWVNDTPAAAAWATRMNRAQNRLNSLLRYYST